MKRQRLRHFSRQSALEPGTGCAGCELTSQRASSPARFLVAARQRVTPRQDEAPLSSAAEGEAGQSLRGPRPLWVLAQMRTRVVAGGRVLSFFFRLSRGGSTVASSDFASGNAAAEPGRLRGGRSAANSAIPDQAFRRD